MLSLTVLNLLAAISMTKLTRLCAAVLACAAVQAHASVITLQTAYSTAQNQASAAAYRDVVDAAVQTQAAGYGTAVLAAYDNVSNAGQFGSNHDVAWKATIDFGVTAAQAGSWSFRTGVDFGYGGAMFLDGNAVDMKNTNMWWSGSYGDPAQFLAATLNVGAGNHTLSIYGLEDCCDGAQQAQFRIGSGAYTGFARADGLNAVAVPEPLSLATFGLGLGLIAGLRRRVR
jgi:hypothetical protein